MKLSRRLDCGRMQSSMKPHQAQILLSPGRAQVWVSQQGRGNYLMMILVWNEEEEEEEEFGRGVAMM